MYHEMIERLESMVGRNAETGAFRCKREIFTDPEFFELEMRYI